MGNGFGLFMWATATASLASTYALTRTLYISTITKQFTDEAPSIQVFVLTVKKSLIEFRCSYRHAGQTSYLQQKYNPSKLWISSTDHKHLNVTLNKIKTKQGKAIYYKFQKLQKIKKRLVPTSLYLSCINVLKSHQKNCLGQSGKSI